MTFINWQVSLSKLYLELKQKKEIEVNLRSANLWCPHFTEPDNSAYLQNLQEDYDIYVIRFRL